MVLGGVGVGSRGPARQAVVIKAAAPATPTAAQRLSARAHFQGRAVSLSRAGYSFEMKDPVPVLLEPCTTRSGGIGSGGGEGEAGRGRMKPQKLGAKARMGVSARGPHSVRAHSRGQAQESAAVAINSSAG